MIDYNYISAFFCLCVLRFVEFEHTNDGRINWLIFKIILNLTVAPSIPPHDRLFDMQHVIRGHDFSPRVVSENFFLRVALRHLIKPRPLITK